MHRTVSLLLVGAAFVLASPAPASAQLLEDERNTIDVFQQTSDAVVFIRNERVRRNYWTGDVMLQQQGTGSGFVWDREGHVVTNFHVIRGGEKFFVVFGDGSEYEAEVKGWEETKDLAVLKVEAPDELLNPIEPGDSDAIRVGQKVLAIGAPFELDQTLTTGVVSAMGREIRSVAGNPITGVIQTDASINPGNSGGPLLDSAGRLIGVNTAIVNRTGANVGIGFAVPVNTVLRVVPQLIETGRVSRAGLGIGILRDAVMVRLGLEGVGVQAVTRRSPADQAGLRPLERLRNGRIVGDIIVEIAGTPVKRFDDLYKALDPFDPGDEIEVVVLRDLEDRKRLRLELTDISRR